MALLNGFSAVPWSVDGGEHPGALLRLVAYAALGAAEGVVTPGDLKVQALATPGTQIRVATGAAEMINRSPNVAAETYIVHAGTESRVDVTATGAGVTRYDMVCVRVEDPEYPFGGFTPPPNPTAALNWQYVVPFIQQNVAASATTAAELNLGYPALALARIAIPPSTSTITDAMITDLRKVARPRRDSFHTRYNVPYSPQESGALLNQWVHFPDIANAVIAVPSWATKAIVRVDITGPTVVFSSLAGYFRYRLNGGSPTTDVSTAVTYVNEQIAGETRKSVMISDFPVIPAAMRGRTVAGIIEYFQTGGSGYYRALADTQMVVEIQFIEAAS